jgi:hypothetical protein
MWGTRTQSRNLVGKQLLRHHPDRQASKTPPEQKSLTLDKYDVSVIMSGIRVQGDPCTATIFWSIARLHPLYSASSPVTLTKYSIIHNRISS